MFIRILKILAWFLPVLTFAPFARASTADSVEIVRAAAPQHAQWVADAGPMVR